MWGWVKRWFVLLHRVVVIISTITATSVFSTSSFPHWFRILFLVGTFCLIVWVMMALSFVAAAAVHQFFLFRPAYWTSEFLLDADAENKTQSSVFGRDRDRNFLHILLGLGHITRFIW